MAFIKLYNIWNKSKEVSFINQGGRYEVFEGKKAFITIHR
jgi:hypothetical protein